MAVADQSSLDRFVEAQHGTYETALAELRAGSKSSHWMWFIFPQVAGLGRSQAARFYAIRSPDEARAFLTHPLLGQRYRACVTVLLDWAGRRSAVEIFGGVDAMKLRSSLTLFSAASGEPLFGDALAAFFPEGPDAETLRRLEGCGRG